MADRKILFRTGGGFNEASTTADRISSAGLVSGAADIVFSRNGSATDRITIGSGSTTIDNPLLTVSTSSRAGIRIGSYAGDPSSLANGDLWYNSTSGKLRAYQAGAPTDVIGGGSGSGDAVSKAVSQATHGLAVQDVIRHNGTSWVKARADASSTLGIGVVTAVADANNFTVTLAGYATISSHGLTAGQYYFCSAATSGLLTSTEPASGYSNPILFAVDTDTVIVLPYRPSSLSVFPSWEEAEDNSSGSVTTALVTPTTVASPALTWTQQTTGNILVVVSGTAVPASPPNDMRIGLGVDLGGTNYPGCEINEGGTNVTSVGFSFTKLITGVTSGSKTLLATIKYLGTGPNVGVARGTNTPLRIQVYHA